MELSDEHIEQLAEALVGLLHRRSKSTSDSIDRNKSESSVGGLTPVAASEELTADRP